MQTVRKICILVGAILILLVTQPQSLFGVSVHTVQAATKSPAKGHRSSTPRTDTTFVQIVGNPLTIQIGVDGSFQVENASDPVSPTGGQFFPNNSQLGDAGIFLTTQVNGQSYVFGPDFYNHDGGSASNTYDLFTPVSQSPVTGSGTTADPFKQTTVLDVPNTAIRITQMTTYINGALKFDQNWIFSNNGNGKSTPSFNYFYAGDTYFQGSDDGYGYFDPSTGAVGSENSDGTAYLALLPNTPDDAYFEGPYHDVWDSIGQQGMPGVGFDKSVAVDVDIDSGAGLQWNNRAVGATLSSSLVIGSVNSPTQLQLKIVSGDGQNAFLGTNFLTPLQAQVTDNKGNPVPNVVVTFSTLYNTGASFTFFNGGTIEKDTTNSSGFATSTFIKANNVAGNYRALAIIDNTPSTAYFNLGNVANSVDSDGDGLPDIWETQGVTITTATGPHFINLPAMGADPNKKDIFVQLDWMQDDLHHDNLDFAALKIVHDAFAAHSINLHIDEGPDSIMNYDTGAKWGNLSQANALPFNAMLGTNTFDSQGNPNYDFTDFNNLRYQYFDPTGRLPIFRYAVSANAGPVDRNKKDVSGVTPSTSSSAFLVTLGFWDDNISFYGLFTTPTNKDRITFQAGTFMHELGHTLGLNHGGSSDDGTNYKPNYLSIMNYYFQQYGLIKNGKTGIIDYSESALPTLDENNLNENNGLGPQAQGYGTYYYCGSTKKTVIDATKPINWNCQNGLESSVKSDINSDGDIQQLTGYNDWANLKLKNGTIGGLGAPDFPTTTVVDEPTPDELSTPPIYTYYLPFLGNNANGYTSYLAFQNVGSTTANYTLQYYDNTGATISTPTLQGSCATLNVNTECIPSNPFSSGKSGSGLLSSSEPLNVIVAEGTPYGGSAYAVSNDGSNNLVAPLILKGAYGDFNTQLTIFNGGTTDAPVSVTFYNQNGQVQSSASLSQTVAVNTTWTLDQATSTLPEGFNGWAYISSPDDSDLVAQVLEQSQSRKFVAIANAQPINNTDSTITSTDYTLYAPAIFKGAFGFVTGANVVNPNANPVQVTITYYDDSGKSYPAPAFTLNANSIASIYQSGSGTGLPSSPALPNGFSGAATVKSSGGTILMVVNESGGVSASGTSLSGVYAAASSGSGSIGLPVMANGGFGYVTGATVLNTSSNTINGSIQYYNVDGTPQGGPHSFSIGPNASQLVYQGDTAQGLSNGFYGTAIVTETGSDQDLIATTNAESGLFYTYTEPNN